MDTDGCILGCLLTAAIFRFSAAACRRNYHNSLLTEKFSLGELEMFKTDKLTFQQKFI